MEEWESGTYDKNAIQINTWWEGTLLGRTKYDWGGIGLILNNCDMIYLNIG